MDRRPDAGPAGSDAAERGAARPLRGPAAGDLRGRRRRARPTAPRSRPTASPTVLPAPSSRPSACSARRSGPRAQPRPSQPPRTSTSPATPATTSSPTKRRIRVTVDLRVTQPESRTRRPRASTTTTPSSRSWPAPAASRSTGAARATPPSGSSAPASATRSLRARLRASGCTAASRATYRLTFYLKDPGGAATRDLRVGDSLVSFPVWAFATEEHAGQHRHGRLPEGLRRRGRGRQDRRPPTTDDDGRTIFRSGKLAKPLEFFAYLVADRPGRLPRTHRRDRRPRAPGRGPGPGVAGRRSRGPSASAACSRWACRRSATRIGLDWPTYDQPLDRPGGREPHDRRLRRAVRPECGQGRDRVLRRRLRRAPRGGPRLVQRLAAGRSLGERGVRLLLRHGRGGRPRARRSQPTSSRDELAEGPDPAQRLGTGRLRGRGAGGLRVRRVAALARAIAERAGDEGLQAVWADARAGSAPTSRPAAGRPRPSRARRTGAACWTCSRSGPTRPTTTCGGRGSRATPTSRCSTRAPRPASATTRMVAAAGGLAPASTDPRRAAGVALQRRHRAPVRRRGRAGRTRRGHEAAAEAGLIAPASLRLAFEDDDGFDDATAETTAELDVIGRYVAATRRCDRREMTPFLTLGLWGLTPRRRAGRGARRLRDGRPRRVGRRLRRRRRRRGPSRSRSGRAGRSASG